MVLLLKIKIGDDIMRRIFLFLVIVFSPTLLLADDLKIDFSNDGTPVDFELLEGEKVSPGPLIIGGTPADPKDWPATRYFLSQGKACTSTVIGPRILLTAAHCVKNNGVGSFKIGGQKYAVRCLHHTKYKQNYKMDVALCLTNGQINLPNGARYERITFNSNEPSQKSKIKLLGFGCRQIGGGGPSGKLYIGNTKFKYKDGAYIITEGGAAVCYGDSGGASYIQAGNQRAIFGVNSRGDIISRSLLSHTGNSEIKKFFQGFANANTAKICGLNYNSNCHN